MGDKPIIGERIGNEKKYIESLAADLDALNDIESKITSAAFYSSPSVVIDMSSSQWDAVIVLMRWGRKALALDT
jgi:hypothetical protein